MVPRENKNNAYAKFGGTNKEYYGIFRSGLFKGIFCGFARFITNDRKIGVFAHFFIVIDRELQFGKEMPHIVLYLKLVRYIFARISLGKSVVALISFLHPNSSLLETCFSHGQAKSFY